MPQNSTTKVFEKGVGVVGKLESDIEKLPSDVETYKGSANDLPEPENYEKLMTKIQSAPQHKIPPPLLIDLNDSYNQFILDYFNYWDKKIDDQTTVKLIIHDNFVGKVFIQMPDQREEDTDLTIDLKDPRNIHLARMVKLPPQASNTTTTTTTTTVLSSSAEEAEREQPQREERKKSSEEEHKETKSEEISYSRKSLNKFLKYLLYNIVLTPAL